jgi:hypothetical protein
LSIVAHFLRNFRYRRRFPNRGKVLAEILAGVPADEQAKPAPDRDPGIAGGNPARVDGFDLARLTVPA